MVSTALRIGWRKTAFDTVDQQSDIDDYTGLIMNGWIQWELAHESNVRLDLIRSDYPSNFQLNAYYVATGASLIYNLQRGRLLGQLRARYQTNDYSLPDLLSGEDRTDDIATFGLTANCCQCCASSSSILKWLIGIAASSAGVLCPMTCKSRAKLSETR